MNTKTLLYILKRIALAALTVWVVITVTFFVMRAVPGGPFMSEKAISETAQAALEAKYGLDKPVFEQYVTYLKDVFTAFDFGISFYSSFRINAWYQSDASFFTAILFWKNGSSIYSFWFSKFVHLSRQCAGYIWNRCICRLYRLGMGYRYRY